MARLRIARLLGCAVIILGSACSDIGTAPTPAMNSAPLARTSFFDLGSLTTPPQLVEVTRFFAPVIYQHFLYTNWRGDLLTKVSYDGDWIGTNNWENLESFPRNAYVYASIVEDQNRYFIHYGTFHPRDYCDGTGGHGWAQFECPFAGSQHENDMEGVTIAVDKRFATANWPYGQVITAETIIHTWYQHYHNCSLEGGFPVYFTVGPGLSRPRGNYDNGCIPFRAGAPGSTTPNAPKRFELVLDYAGHAAWMQAGATVTADHIQYVPSDNTATDPVVVVDYGGRPRPVSITVIPTPTPYRLQFLTDPELSWSTFSLWDQRTNNSGGPFSGTFLELVQPQGQYFFTHFRGDTHAVNSAIAPWGQAGDGLDIGEWHNHPSWAWRQHWLPSGPFANQYYDYCRTQSCHYQYGYVFNPFWDAPPPPPPPPPPLTLTLTGPASVRSAATCLWTANPTSGIAPYTYAWFVNDVSVNNNSPYPQELIYQNTGSGFTVRAQVNDAAGATGSKSKSVTISPSAPQCLY